MTLPLLTFLLLFQAISEAFKMASDPDLEWTATILDVKPQVILHDRLMTDAALGTAPIKSEHSYSLTSDGDSIPDSPLSLDNKMDGKGDYTGCSKGPSCEMVDGKGECWFLNQDLYWESLVGCRRATGSTDEELRFNSRQGEVISVFSQLPDL
jgi:hypothetical protein